MILYGQKGGIFLTFGEKLRAARKEKKLTQRELAELIHAAHNSISNWENDQNKPDPDTIQNLCWALGVTPNYFFLDSASEQPAVSAPLPSNIVPLSPMQKVPLVGQIACGTPILAEQNITDYVDLPGHIRADFALTCKGESMTGAGIQDGDIVYIRRQEEVENGQIAAVMVGDEEATLKRFYRESNVIQLVSENPTIPPKVFIGEAISQIRVVGLAVAYTHIIE